MEGKATDLSFLSSAKARQFFTVFSSSSSHLSDPQLGLWQWITYLAGSPKPPLRAAGDRDRGATTTQTDRDTERDKWATRHRHRDRDRDTE